MSDSDDEPLIVKRAPQHNAASNGGPAPSAAPAVKPAQAPKPAAPSSSQAPTAPSSKLTGEAAASAAKASGLTAATAKPEPAQPAAPAKEQPQPAAAHAADAAANGHAASNGAAGKANANGSVSSDSEDDMPIGMRRTAGGAGPSSTPAAPKPKEADHGKSKGAAAAAKVGSQQQAASKPHKRPSADGNASGPKAKRRSSDGGAKRVKAEPQHDGSDDDEPKATAHKGKAAAGKGPKAGAGGAKAAAKPAHHDEPKPAKKRGAAKDSDKEGPTKTVRVKKEYDMPGQTKDTPPENDPLCKFYTTLLEQNPKSQMALKWCVERGLLSREDAEEWLAADERRAKKLRTPVKAAPAKPRTAPKKRRAAESDAESEDEVIGHHAAKRPRVKIEPKEAAHKEPHVELQGKSMGKTTERTAAAGKAKAAAASGSKAKPKQEKTSPRSPKAKQHPLVKKEQLFMEDDGPESSDDDMPLAQRHGAAKA